MRTSVSHPLQIAAIGVPGGSRIGVTFCPGKVRPGGWCQTNSNQSQFAPPVPASGGKKRPPLGESGGVVGLEMIPAGEAAFLVEVVVDGRVDGGEHLQTSHPPEPEHRAFASSIPRSCRRSSTFRSDSGNRT